MDYYDWRNDVFNQPIRDLEDADYESDAFNLSLDEALDHIDRALMDDGLYAFKEEQLVIGFSLIFGKTFTDYPWCYTRLPEDRRVRGILNLRLLYSRYFLKVLLPVLSRHSRLPSTSVVDGPPVLQFLGPLQLFSDR